VLVSVRRGSFFRVGPLWPTKPNLHQHQSQQARASFVKHIARLASETPRNGFCSVTCAAPAVPRRAFDKGDWQLLVKAWLGSICDARRCLVLCVTEKEVRRYDVSLFHVVDSSAVAWPVSRMPCGAGKHTIELARSVKGIPFLHTTCSKNATPCKGTWRSWFYQMHHCKKNVAGTQAETRMVLDGMFKDVKQIVAEDVGRGVTKANVGVQAFGCLGWFNRGFPPL